jgi:hypothetical protein
MKRMRGTRGTGGNGGGCDLYTASCGVSYPTDSGQSDNAL